MDYFNLAGIHLAPREIAAFSPIAAGESIREARLNSDDEARENQAREDEDTFTLSDEARALAELELPGAVQNEKTDVEQRNSERDAEKDEAAGNESAAREENAARTGAETELSEDEQRVVNELRSTDQEVRAHEQAHAAAGGNNVRYEYETGPDGQRYAVGGTTDIQVSATDGSAEGKLAQARKMRTAALAPADPSGQDMAVAAKAARIEAEALMEKAEESLNAIT